MNSSASRIKKAEAATETQVVKLVPSYTLRLLVFLSVVLLVAVCLFPVVVARLATLTSRIQEEQVNSQTGVRSSSHLRVVGTTNASDAPAWAGKGGSAANQPEQLIHRAAVDSVMENVLTTIVPTGSSRRAASAEKAPVESAADVVLQKTAQTLLLRRASPKTEALEARRARLAAIRKRSLMQPMDQR